MAVLGGFVLIIIGAFLIWIALMSKFNKIGNKVTNKIENTFEEKGKQNDSSN